MSELTPETINCAEACVNGCVLGDRCPNREYIAAASKFMHETPLDQILQIAADSYPKRLLASIERDRQRAANPPQE
ncbi:MULTISPECIES: hypothetical protein [Thermosynechococcus]|uniref:Tsr1196 protein n=1 Tax=Thermosynechococcus vestitus (strain NIES-2133 / IAM M-273 / BP-1) TaxID=197221 RepID=Q8DJM6_THEVB|nr:MULTISPECIES: hypothetical protein [Thermosynechococcus]BAC08748.1 tsr1196 [Thermosynechococcus vestitus BP-1]BAY51083.1 hypothetical protein NIES2134_113330 [Thermostichus vulcanus NIES-2134]HIK23544.1 hypothetical protein [Thermosynechococcus sp. M3746_W2019_013]